MLIARDDAAASTIAAARQSPHLPGVTLDATVSISGRVTDAAKASMILLAVPAQTLRTALMPLADAIRSDTVLVAGAKGI